MKRFDKVWCVCALTAPFPMTQSSAGQIKKGGRVIFLRQTHKHWIR